MSLLSESHISFINLDHRTDRLVLMQQALAKAGLQAVRTRGMLPSEYTGDPNRVEVMQKRTKGAIGCHFSQVAVMTEALRQNRHAFVMEDDLIFCSDFQERLALMDRFTETHPWDCLWLGGTFHVNPPWWHKDDLGRDAETTDDPRFMRTYGAFSTHAYIVNRDSIAKILELLDQWLSKSIGIDWAMIQIQPQLQTFAFVPGCVIQRDINSDIGLNSNGTPGFTKFSGFSKLGAHWFQNLLTDFDPLAYNWAEAQR